MILLLKEKTKPLKTASLSASKQSHLSNSVLRQAKQRTLAFITLTLKELSNIYEVLLLEWHSGKNPTMRNPSEGKTQKAP